VTTNAKKAVTKFGAGEMQSEIEEAPFAAILPEGHAIHEL